MRREDLQQRRFARAVAADDAHHLAALDLERHVLERPELLDLVAGDELAAAHHVARRCAKPFACRARSHRAAPCSARCCASWPMKIFLAEAFGANDDVAHGCALTPDRRRCARCAGNSRCRAKGRTARRQAHQKARQIELAFAAEHAPAETVDHADHRIEAVPEPPLLRAPRAEKPTGET